MVFFEEIAAPPVLLIHVGTFVLGAVFWFFGFVIMLTMIWSGKLQSLARMANKMFLIGGLLFGIGFIAGSLLYPAFRINVLGRPLVINMAFPYMSFLFDGSLLFLVKQWVAAIGGLAFIGTIVFNSGEKRRFYIALLLCLIVLATFVIDTVIAILLTATSAL